MMKQKLLSGVLSLVGLLPVLTACHEKQPAEAEKPTINTTLQAECDSVLRRELNECGDITCAQAFVMETETGNLKALARVAQSDSTAFYGTELMPDTVASLSFGLVHPILAAAALKTKNISMTDEIDTGNGIYVTNDGIKLLDLSYRRGGYGKITLKQGLMQGSTIAVRKALEISGLTEKTYLARKLYDMECPFPTHPLQMLAFYNALANNGIMMKPRKTENTQKERPFKVLSESTVKALTYVMKKKAAKMNTHATEIPIAGNSGFTILPNHEYVLGYCGYFPADKPRYTVLVLFQKKGNIATSAELPKRVVRELVNYMGNKIW